MKRGKTYSAREKDIKRAQYFVDASGKILGRLATAVSCVLRGKHKETFTTHVDTGDFVTVINAGQIKVTGNKIKEKIYFTHSGYPHGHKLLNFEEVSRRDPSRIIRLAVAGMLPKGPLGRKTIKKLKIFNGPHEVSGKELKV